VIFDEELMLQESQRQDIAQGRASESLIDFQSKEFEFSDDPNKPVGSDENSSDLDGDIQESTQEQHVQPRSLRRLDRVSVPQIRYG